MPNVSLPSIRRRSSSGGTWPPARLLSQPNHAIHQILDGRVQIRCFLAPCEWRQFSAGSAQRFGQWVQNAANSLRLNNAPPNAFVTPQERPRCLQVCNGGGNGRGNLVGERIEIGNEHISTFRIGNQIFSNQVEEKITHLCRLTEPSRSLEMHFLTHETTVDDHTHRSRPSNVTGAILSMGGYAYVQSYYDCRCGRTRRCPVSDISGPTDWNASHQEGHRDSRTKAQQCQGCRAQKGERVLFHFRLPTTGPSSSVSNHKNSSGPVAALCLGASAQFARIPFRVRQFFRLTKRVLPELQGPVFTNSHHGIQLAVQERTRLSRRCMVEPRERMRAPKLTNAVPYVDHRDHRTIARSIDTPVDLPIAKISGVSRHTNALRFDRPELVWPASTLSITTAQ